MSVTILSVRSKISDPAAMYERWPLQFSSPANAVSWADKFLNQPRLRSQFSQIMSSALQGKTRKSVDKHGERITADRLVDEAETISVCLSAVQNPAGTLYRHVYGRHPRTLQTADQLARLVWDGAGPRKIRTMAGMRVLAVLMIEDARIRHTGNQAGMPWSHVYAQMSVERSQFDRSWKSYALKMKGHLDAWIYRAERDMTEQLADRGIL